MHYKGEGIIDSLMSAVTSTVTKDVATKALDEVGNRGSQRFIDEIIPPSKSLHAKSKQIIAKHAIPIQKYVKSF